jgi:hypothetical protein
MRNLQVALTRGLGQHYTVLAGLRVTLKYGLFGTKLKPTSLPVQRADCTPFHATRCVGDP